jgi:hypothetical protein
MRAIDATGEPPWHQRAKLRKLQTALVQPNVHSGRIAMALREARVAMSKKAEVRVEHMTCLHRFGSRRIGGSIEAPGRILGEGISGLEPSVVGCYQLSKGHTYTLVAHYQDSTVTPPRPPGDAQYLSNELVAPPVEFQF